MKVVNSDTKLLKDFQAGQIWDLRPGDMLYLPPRIPHEGEQTVCICIRESHNISV